MAVFVKKFLSGAILKSVYEYDRSMSITYMFLLTGIVSRKAAVLWFMCGRYLFLFFIRRPDAVTIGFRGFP
jgi:hypothetical protein